MRCFPPFRPSRACVLIKPLRVSRTNTPNKGRFHRLAAHPTGDPARPRCGPRPRTYCSGPASLAALSGGTQTQQLIPAELVAWEGRVGGRRGGGLFQFSGRTAGPSRAGPIKRSPAAPLCSGPSRCSVPRKGGKKRNAPCPRTIIAPPPPSSPPPTCTPLAGSHRRILMQQQLYPRTHTHTHTNSSAALAHKSFDKRLVQTDANTHARTPTEFRYLLRIGKNPNTG